MLAGTSSANIRPVWHRMGRHFNLLLLKSNTSTSHHRLPTAMASLVAGSRPLLRGTAVPSLHGRCTHCTRRPSPHLAANAAQHHPCRTPPTARGFSSSNGGGKRPRFSQRLGEALRNSKVQWYPIPVGLGIGFLGLVQFYKVSAREKKQRELEDGADDGARPKRRPRIRPEGPWQVQVMSTLPLKAISRLWGRFNELTIPYYLRVPGFKLYSFIFGVKQVPHDSLKPQRLTMAQS